MKQRFSIGEMAKMHHVAESTLRYYDQIGVFQPRFVDSNTKYRYYTVDQFTMLDIIKFLRHLGISLDEISSFLDQRSPSFALDLLQKQVHMMSQKQQELEYLIAKINSKINTINKGLQATESKIFFKQLPKRVINSIAVDAISSEDMLDYYINTLQHDLQSLGVTLFTGDIGVSVTQAAIMQKKYHDYKNIFILLDHLQIKNELYEHIPAGLFACIYHIGPYEQTGTSYEQLLKEIKKQGYQTNGDAIEISLIDVSVSRHSEKFVTEIQIPIVEI